jgi:pimeloyl-ACP methyl ester carboxylesterase
MTTLRRAAILGLSGAAVPAALWTARHVSARSVRRWSPGGGKFVRAGKLVTRTAGSCEPVYLLLHGLVASGETFGAAFDVLAESGALVVPDLLGFSRSMDGDRFSLEDHLDALDEMVAALRLSQSRFVIGGHSFGGLLALHWAARRTAQVEAVVTWGAPLFRDEAEGQKQLKKMGMLERLFAEDTDFARTSCEWMCAHRGLAGALAVALSPDLPVPVSRRGVCHTWPAYRGAMEVLFSDWQAALRVLEQQRVPVRLVAGTNDRSQVSGLDELLARRYANIATTQIDNAAHIIALTHDRECAQQLLRSHLSRHVETA